MSLVFTGSNSQYLSISSTLNASTYTSLPFSFAAWLRIGSTAGNIGVCRLHDNGASPVQRFAVQVSGTNNNATCLVQNGINSVSISTPNNSWTDDTWFYLRAHGEDEGGGAASVHCQIDQQGWNSSGSVGSAEPTNMDVLEIGRASASIFLTGEIEHPLVCSNAFDDEPRATFVEGLSYGMHPYCLPSGGGAAPDDSVGFDWWPFEEPGNLYSPMHVLTWTFNGSGSLSQGLPAPVFHPGTRR